MMPKLPDETALARRMPTGGTPQISVKGLDYSPMARSGEAVGQGISAVGRGFSAMAEANAEIDDFDTKKKLLDFKLKTEMDLENFSREMPPGGDGFSEAWQKRYKENADNFFGKDGQNIPLSQRRKVDYQLVQHDTSLSERAQRAALKEQDRYHVDELESSLGQYKDVVGANPDRHGEMGDEGRKLIELSRIPSADKYRLVKKYEKELDKSKATAFLMMPKTPENRDRLKAELRLDQEDAPTSASGPVAGNYRDQIKKFEGFTAKASWDYKQHSVGYGTRAKHAGEVISKDEAEKRLDEELGKAGDIVDKFAPGLDGGTRAALVSLTFNAGAGWMNSGLGKAVKAGDLEAAKSSFLQYNKAGGETLPGLADRRRKEAEWIGRGGPVEAAPAQPTGPVQALDPSRPYANLSIGERRAVWKQYETEWKHEITKVDTEIKHLNERATNGDLPPEIELQQIAGKIKNLGDPVLQAKYDSTLSLANAMNKMFLAPPQAAEAFVRNTRTAVAEAQGGRYTEEQEKHLKHLEKAADTVRKNVNEDPLGWAHKRQLEVPTGDLAQPGQTDEMGQAVEQPRRKVVLKPIDFNPANKDLDASLTERFEVGREVGRYYNQPPQFFSKSDRDALKDAVAKGGAPMVHILGKIVANGGNDALAAIREFSKDAPEAYMIGKLMSEGGDAKLIDDASKEMTRRATEKDKYINKVDRKLADPDVTDLMPVLARTPGLQDPVKHLTDTIYNYRHRYLGKDAFDATLYKNTMKEVLGERKDRDGTVYGGVGSQNDGWFTDSKVLVPPQVRQDSFPAMIGALRSDDFQVLGTPTYANGQPMAIRDVQRATWMSRGNGLYDLKIGEDSDGTAILARHQNGDVYVVDIKKVLGAIKTRKPEIFGQ